MKPILTIIIAALVLALQIVAGQILGLGGAMATGAGNGWELLLFALGDTIGVWTMGALAARLQGTFSAYLFQIRLLGTAVGSALGVVAILITPATGFGQMLYPLAGTLIGYYTPAFLIRPQ
ncbi:MAG: hypothetical protein KJZ86_26620 [Caldilineaceae bacterium]|nr:hypothetical protein [Caldilineaceae bacterium]HRJ43703.1 hypothetical protein [Caldilineaceae bacterium]